MADPTSVTSSDHAPPPPPPPPPLFSLGLIADIQYADMADSHVEGRTQRFRECPAKLEAALSAIRSESQGGSSSPKKKLAALLTLGDVINGNREDASLNPSDLETVASLLDAAFPPGGEVPVYHVLGNHCLDLPKRRVTERLSFPPSALLPQRSSNGDDNTAAAAATADVEEKKPAASDDAADLSSAPPACYSVPLHPGWRLVALDTTEMSGHAQDSGDSARARAAREYLAAYPLTEGEGSENPQMSPWNGGPGAEQVAWLRGELQRAAESGERVVVAGHHQVGPGRSVRRTHAAWNWREVSEVVTAGKLKGGVEVDAPDASGPAPPPSSSPSSSSPSSSSKSPAVLYLAGHDHTGGYERAGGVHFLTLEAIVEAPPGSNAFAVLDFFDDRIVVRGFGSATSRVLDLV